MISRRVNVRQRTGARWNWHKIAAEVVYEEACLKLSGGREGKRSGLARNNAKKGEVIA
jgi:hypothetical protein